MQIISVLGLGDVFKLAPTLKAKSCDHCICDAPFGIGRQYGDWEEPKTWERHWKDTLEPFLEEAKRLTKGYIAVCQGYKYGSCYREYLGHRYAPCTTLAYRRGVCFTTPWCIIRADGKTPRIERSKLFYSGKFGALDRNIRINEVARPYSSCEYVVKLLTKPGDRVFCPFTGSGQIELALIRNNRSFFGVERYRPYFDEAVERLCLYAPPDTELVPYLGRKRDATLILGRSAAV